MEDLIYGKDKRQRLVATEVKNNVLYLFQNDGSIETIDYLPWLLTDRDISGAEALEGNLTYKFITYYDSYSEYTDLTNQILASGIDSFEIKNKSEQAMTLHGITLFKGLKVQDVSVLSFDIETNGLLINDESHVYLISNTFRDASGRAERKLFSIDQFDNQKQMIDAWCAWVNEKNPTVLCGHNIFGFDLPFLFQCSGRNLPIGRDGSNIYISGYVSQFRKDGSQSYDYNNIKVFGRQVIDTMFLSIKYDFARKYVSYGLKQIIKQEGLEKEGRVHYEAGSINENWDKPEERERIKQYAIDDSDDALQLYDLMIPSFFYYAQSIPRNLQDINNSATGSQINSMLRRTYLQQFHSIPKKSEPEKYEGAISFGNPGIYNHVMKVDVASLYPSIIRQYKIYDADKDPKQHFLKMVEYFTDERLKNKQEAKETGDRYYKDLEQSRKITINSAYGMMGAAGLNFNSPKNAALITEKGREILQKGIDWVERKGYQLINVDTDSFSYSKNRPVDKIEFASDIVEINSMYPEHIVWADDGYYPKVIVITAKNYVLYDGEKITYKGSSLKDQKKEPALRELLTEALNCILFNRISTLPSLYESYIKEIYNVKDISRWATKKTVTKAVLTGERLNESKVRDAIGDKYVKEGDKIYVYPAIDGVVPAKVKGQIVRYKKTNQIKYIENKILKTIDQYNNDLDKMHLVKRVYSTMMILENVIEKDLFLNYSLAKYKNHLQNLTM